MAGCREGWFVAPQVEVDSVTMEHCMYHNQPFIPGKVCPGKNLFIFSCAGKSVTETFMLCGCDIIGGIIGCKRYMNSMEEHGTSFNGCDGRA